MTQMTDFSGIINWDNVFKQSETFKNNKPYPYAFIENLFEQDFYDKLYESYPILDDFVQNTTISKTQWLKYWKANDFDVVKEGEDPTVGKEWNRLKLYIESDEFLEKLRKFSGIPVNKLRYCSYHSYRKGGFQLPHKHNVGPTVIVAMMYFSKGWKKGDAGGTFISTGMDESSIVYEPYNLDNSMVIFQDGPNSYHGCRYIEKDVERRALQIYWDRFENGSWVG